MCHNLFKVLYELVLSYLNIVVTCFFPVLIVRLCYLVFRLYKVWTVIRLYLFFILLHELMEMIRLLFVEQIVCVTVI